MPFLRPSSVRAGLFVGGINIYELLKLEACPHPHPHPSPLMQFQHSCFWKSEVKLCACTRLCNWQSPVWTRRGSNRNVRCCTTPFNQRLAIDFSSDRSVDLGYPHHVTPLPYPGQHCGFSGTTAVQVQSLLSLRACLSLSHTKTCPKDRSPHPCIYKRT